MMTIIKKKRSATSHTFLFCDSADVTLRWRRLPFGCSGNGQGGFIRYCCCAESGVAMPNVHFLLPFGPSFLAPPSIYDEIHLCDPIYFFFFPLYLDSKKLGPVFFLSFSSSSLPIHFIPLDRGTILRLDLAMSLIHYSICLALIHIAYANGISATFPQISIKVGPFFLFFSSFNVDFHSPKCAYTVYV
jgi:hypothetical protein